MRATSNGTTDVDGREPVTRRIHTEPWTADLERPRHGKNRRLVVEEAIDAIAQTGAPYLDLVIHGRHGNPATYLYPELESRPQSVSFDVTGRCSCGGYVVRVQVGSAVSQRVSECRGNVHTRH